ncbi:T9SS type A sorting domain-containing protein [Parvicella tangerina]|uniref:Secretion system C-terminal sorting domain-containing protein n=1 Tax=Parvicella tangerina TaxID=2829795 RepID=A0A916JQI5_9FLAO|nr:T9SS type A sorting domain-containing protein [Parvicella tangerina]CAG5087312.1 hypothetical protein CRYO30217_03450 [Parvicella tangerina]
MKKIILLVLAVAPLFSLAQHHESATDSPQDLNQILQKEVRMEQKSGAIIWSEDFASGWPAGWITIDSSGICPWVYSTDGTWGYFNGNNGTSGTNDIQSSTASNGFLICDVDSANNVTYGQPSGSNYNYLSTYFEIPPINCATNSSVILEFEQKFRYNNSVSMNVLVSTDSINWTGFDVSGGLANNTISADPDIVTLNLSSIAANQPKVHIRIGWSARVYYWMIDDMVLREGNENDLANLSGYWETGNELLEYYQTPLSQLTPMTFKGAYTNIGNNGIPNVSQEVNVDFGGSSVYSASSTPDTSIVATIDSVTIPGTFTPSSGVGTYDVTWTVSSADSVDLNNADNTTQRDFVVSDLVYARDNGVTTGSIGNFSSNAGQTFKIGNLYETFGSATNCAVYVGISSDATNDGQIIYAEVYRWNATGGTFDFVETTDDYVISSVDLGSVISVPLLNPVDVVAGELYLVVAGHYGGTDEVRFLLCQAVEEQTVYGYRADGSLVYLSSPRAPLVRMKLNSGGVCAESVEENSLANISAYPNPFAEETTIALQLSSATSVIMEIIDLDGRVISTTKFGQLPSGTTPLTIEASSLAAGMYTCRITAGDEVLTERIVVAK